MGTSGNRGLINYIPGEWGAEKQPGTSRNRFPGFPLCHPYFLRACTRDQAGPEQLSIPFNKLPWDWPSIWPISSTEGIRGGIV